MGDKPLEFLSVSQFAERIGVAERSLSKYQLPEATKRGDRHAAGCPRQSMPGMRSDPGEAIGGTLRNERHGPSLSQRGAARVLLPTSTNHVNIPRLKFNKPRSAVSLLAGDKR